MSETSPEEEWETTSVSVYYGHILPKISFRMYRGYLPNKSHPAYIAASDGEIYRVAKFAWG